MNHKQILLKRYRNAEKGQNWKLMGFLEWISLDWFGKDINEIDA